MNDTTVSNKLIGLLKKSLSPEEDIQHLKDVAELISALCTDKRNSETYYLLIRSATSLERLRKYIDQL